MEMKHYQFMFGSTMEILTCALLICAIALMFVYAYDTIKSQQKYNKHPNWQALCDLEMYCSDEMRKSLRPSHPIKHNDKYMEVLKDACLAFDNLKKFW